MHQHLFKLTPYKRTQATNWPSRIAVQQKHRMYDLLRVKCFALQLEIFHRRVQRKKWIVLCKWMYKSHKGNFTKIVCRYYILPFRISFYVSTYIEVLIQRWSCATRSRFHIYLLWSWMHSHCKTSSSVDVIGGMHYSATFTKRFCKS